MKRIKKQFIFFFFLLFLCSFSVSAAENEEAYWFLDHINARMGWEYLTNLIPDLSSSPIVAVIDTGCDYTHPILNQGLWKNEAEINGLPGVDDDHNGYIDDFYGIDTINHDSDPMDDSTSAIAGHGTHVAGCVLLTAGVTPDSNPYGIQIMPLKAGDSYGNFTEDSVLEAISYAIDKGASVINMSFRKKKYSDRFYQALLEASKHAILVSSAGNDGMPTSDSGLKDSADCYPAGFPFVVGVMSHSQSNTLSDFSNWDAKAYSEVEYDLAAPGHLITSAGIGGYKTMSGTSMSSGIVSGAAALLCVKYGSSLSPRTLAGLLAESSQSFLTYRDLFGTLHYYPRLDLYDVLTCEPVSRLILSQIALEETTLSFTLSNRGLPVSFASITLEDSEDWSADGLPLLFSSLDSLEVLSKSFTLRHISHPENDGSQEVLSPPRLILTYQTEKDPLPVSCYYSLPIPDTDSVPSEPDRIPMRGFTISLPPFSIMRPQETKEIVAVYLPENTTDSKVLSYSSTHPDVVSVDENGILTAHAPGDAAIIIRTQNGLVRSGNIHVIATVFSENQEESKVPEDSKIPAPVPVSPVKTKIQKSQIHLSDTRFYYNGKKQRPSISVKNSSKDVLKKNRDYTIRYSKTNSRLVGSYWVKITGIGNYTGSFRYSYRIEIPFKKIYTVGKIRYKITSKTSHSRASRGTVTAFGPAKKGVRLSSVPKKVKIGGKLYRVTSVRKNAFR